MRIAEMNWMQVEQHVTRDRRAVLPMGSTEQHAQLSLCVDAILAERVAVEAAKPLDVPVFPAINYGLTPNFVDYPGTVTLRLSTLCALVVDVLDGIVHSGFRQIVIVNGHGGNSPAQGAVLEWLNSNRGVQVKWHNWYNAPQTWAKVKTIDPIATHASWMENFPWTRLPGVTPPTEAKAVLDMTRYQRLDPGGKKALVGDGNFGGLYQRSDDDMLALWEIAVAETRTVIATDWD
ncbi:MAG TPA: creatininase family protein [Casimicrobiaceae bacterium]|nr:creatininase family protein [Casimicrobiaceae bacterium]